MSLHESFLSKGDQCSKEMQELEDVIKISQESTDEPTRTFEIQAHVLQKNFYKCSTNDEKTVEAPVGKPLEVIYHEPIYQVPLYLTADFRALSLQERTKLLFDKFTKQSNQLDKIYRESLERAPFPSERKIKSSKCIEEDALSSFVPSPGGKEIYISKAGRQVKRKNYSEDNFIDETDADFGLFAKKSKSTEDDMKITLDMPFPIEEPSTSKPKLDYRNSLLANRGKKTGRAEQLFDELTNAKQKQEQADSDREAFVNSLNYDDKEDEFDFNIEEDKVNTFDLNKDRSSSGNIKDLEEVVYPAKRVEPPTTIVKGKKKGKKFTSFSTDKPVNSTKSTDFPPDIVVRSLVKNTNLRKKKSIDETRVVCPICDNLYPRSEIEDHASTCGEGSLAVR